VVFNILSYDYDVAIIKLKRKVDFKTPGVSPICLPAIEENFEFVNNENLIVSGLGFPYEDAITGARTLQKLDVPYINLTECLKYTRGAYRHLCGGYLEGGKDACAV